MVSVPGRWPICCSRSRRAASISARSASGSWSSSSSSVGLRGGGAGRGVAGGGAGGRHWAKESGAGRQFTGFRRKRLMAGPASNWLWPACQAAGSRSGRTRVRKTRLVRAARTRKSLYFRLSLSTLPLPALPPPSILPPCCCCPCPARPTVTRCGELGARPPRRYCRWPTSPGFTSRPAHQALQQRPGEALHFFLEEPARPARP